MLDGDGMAINDAMVEVWQADAQGRYAHPSDGARPNTKFMGFGRSATDKNGVFSFDTIKPGSVPGPNGKAQAPHVVFCIFSRGMLRQIYTRLYFADEAANDGDPILSLVPADRRGTLIAHKEVRGGLPVLPLRHPGPGRERNRFLRHLKFRWRRLLPGRRPRERRLAQRCPQTAITMWAEPH